MHPMNNTSHLHRKPGQAFTLIELIVVVAIIAILAALIIPIAGVANQHKQIALAQTQLKYVESAIDEYKTKLGFYPPDNTNNFAMNPLYFELMGTTNDGAGQASGPTVYGTLDGSAWINTKSSPSIVDIFSLSGFANTSTRSRSDDQGAAATTFLKNLTPSQIGVPDPANAPIKTLVCSIQWPQQQQPYPFPKAPQLTPIYYDSSFPTNNTGRYDLWIDLIFKGKTNRICNWNPNPIIL